MQTFISKTAKNPERIAKWLDYMTSNEGIAAPLFGFEGKDYTLKDGLVVRTEQGVRIKGLLENGSVYCSGLSPILLGMTMRSPSYNCGRR